MARFNPRAHAATLTTSYPCTVGRSRCISSIRLQLRADVQDVVHLERVRLRPLVRTVKSPDPRPRIQWRNRSSRCFWMRHALRVVGRLAAADLQAHLAAGPA